MSISRYKLFELHHKGGYAMKMLIRTALLSLVLATAPAVAQKNEAQLSIGTGGTGGVWYPLGGAMANILSKTLPNLAVTAEVTGGSVDNIKLISTASPSSASR
jgi:uncharacterized protein